MFEKFESPAAWIQKQMPHFLTVFYARKSFDLYHQGVPREDAESIARKEILDSGAVSKDVIFPPVPWEKYKEFYP